jgi:hypothetical protein
VPQDNRVDYTQYAGRVVFPRGPQDLTSTSVCPACFTPLKTAVCSSCGLDLTHPAAGDLAAASGEAAGVLDRRLSIIGRIRYETAQRLAPQAVQTAAPAMSTPVQAQTAFAANAPVAAPTVLAPTAPAPAAAPTAASAAAPSATVPAPGAPEPVTPTTATNAQPKRSSVQVILLIVGVSLLSIAAIFFLVYAFITFGIVVRSIIIGAITIAAIVVASLLRRKNLRATAEGIAGFGVVLVYLDAFALRVNDLFGLGSADGLTYWGVTLVVSSIAFVLWNRASGLRVPHIAGFAAFAPGVGLLVAGLGNGLNPWTRTFSALAAVALAGLVHPLAARWVPARAGQAPVPTSAGQTPAAHAAVAGTAGQAPAVGTVSAPAATQAPAPTTGLPERIIVLAISSVGALFALGFAFAVEPERPWAPAIALAVLTVIALLHVLVHTRRADAPAAVTAFVLVIAGIGGAAAASAVASGVLRTGDNHAVLLWPAITAAVVAFTLEVLAPRLAQRRGHRPALVATWAAAVVATLALLAPLLVAVYLTVITAVPAVAFGSWHYAPTDQLVEPDAHYVFALAAVAGVTALAAAFWAASGVLVRRRAILVWPVCGVVVLAVPLLSVAWLVIAGWLLAAAIGVALLIATTRRAVPLSLRLPLVIGTIIAGLLGYAASWASTGTWWWGSTVVIGLLLVARLVFRNRVAATTPNASTETPSASTAGSAAVGVKAALLGVAAVVGLVASAALARQLALGDDLAWQLGDSLRFVSLLSIVLVVVSSLLPRVIATLVDRRTLFWIATPVAAASAGTLWVALSAAPESELVSLLLPEYGTSLVLGLVLVGGLLLWAILRSNEPLRAERIAASIAIAPSVYWVVDSFARVIDLPDFARSVAPVTSALIVAAGALAITLVRPSTIPRWAREVGIAVVGVPAVISAVLTHGDATWLVLLLAGITVLVLAISADGLFASASWRRHSGWLALAFATAGLWWRLRGDEVTALEPYVLPIAGALLLIALLVRRADRRRVPASQASGSPATGLGTPDARAPQSPAPGSPMPGAPAPASETPGRAAPAIALGGLLVAILPLAVNGATGELLRAIIVGAVSAALLLVGTLTNGSLTNGTLTNGNRTLRPYLDGAALAGAIGVIVTAFGRAAFLALDRTALGDLRIDGWLVAAFIVLVAAAFGLARPQTDASARLRSVAAQVLGIVAMTGLLVLECTVFHAATLGGLRAIMVVLLFSAILVLAFLTDYPPLTATIGWIAIAYAAVAAIVGIAVGALDPLELGAVPIAIALLAAGAVHLERTPAARSWPFLAPGLLVLLVPSLVATIGDRPVWRLVALGVVAVAALVIGLVLRLQAPFVIGTVIALIHGIATFSHEIRIVYEAVPWWLWLGIGGVILIALAARYEHRIKNLKSAALKLASLR